MKCKLLRFSAHYLEFKVNLVHPQPETALKKGRDGKSKVVNLIGASSNIRYS